MVHQMNFRAPPLPRWARANYLVVSTFLNQLLYSTLHHGTVHGNRYGYLQHSFPKIGPMPHLLEGDDEVSQLLSDRID